VSRKIHRDYAPRDIPRPAEIATAYRLAHELGRETRKHGCQGDIKHTGYSVLHELIRLMIRHGRCFPSHLTIADSAECGEATVRRQLNELRDAGIITWETRRYKGPDKSGRLRERNSSNLYRLGSRVTEQTPVPLWISSNDQIDRLGGKTDPISECTNAVAPAARGQRDVKPAWLPPDELIRLRKKHVL
jgi:hypothetical protein